MSGDRVAIYLQDAHPIRDGMRYAQYAERTISLFDGRIVEEKVEVA